ncbi:JAB domain-containing protein [[Mycobacterium] holstebronense]|uniref:DNA repair protein RadC n=1 Tax=[Mycobacterium] holstebronense TaxID=3064288 RepID=A0ABN9NRA7_9MYCO|nr:DNA repair protein RadC [Mycolicibacter sp. MU0102]CAJ1508107.1 DNA repair protein RadC [Mycolicibacter sp. MU0102]
MLINALPPTERPRERLHARGVDALTDCELIALVLRNGTTGKSAVDLAAELIAEFGSAQDLARARPEELATVPGVGPAKAAALVAAFQLSSRSVRTDPVQLRAADDVATIARAELANARRERLIVVICDAGNRLQRVVAVAEGALDRSVVPVREILNAVLRHDGRAFAIAHNHPGATAEPSAADRRTTDLVKAAATTVGLRFLGHIIVTKDCWEVAA